MVSMLHRKLLRDLWSMKGQAITIALVVMLAAGVLPYAYFKYRRWFWAARPRKSSFATRLLHSGQMDRSIGFVWFEGGGVE